MSVAYARLCRTHTKLLAKVAMDPIQLEHRIRFELDRLGERNSHHEFERLCFEVARRRIATNLIPATGPVSAGGDQGRDAESHWTAIPAEGLDSQPTWLLGTRISDEPTVLACTIQKTDIPRKIKRDLHAICTKGTPVRHVVYFTVEAVPVGKRHELIEHAEESHSAKLTVLDALALAKYLSDDDLWYATSRYLHIDQPALLADPEESGDARDSV